MDNTSVSAAFYFGGGVLYPLWPVMAGWGICRGDACLAAGSRSAGNWSAMAVFGTLLLPHFRMEEPSHDAEEYWQLPVCIKGVTAQTSKGVAHYHYNSLQDAYDDQKRWFLFLDKRHAFVLPKEAMTMGNPEMFVDFWKSKSGKDMIKIKSRRLHR